jgi:pimeloyl-ACP methyl ester carboxylesterase
MIDTNSLAEPATILGAEGVSRTESPVRFRSGDDYVFGMLTEPLGTPLGLGIVLLNAASDRNRFLARLARRLAALGFHVLRFDYRGFGESSGPTTGSDVKHAVMTLTTGQEPFTEDLLGAVELLHQRGLDDIVLIGRCFGARTALSGIRHIRGLRGVALLSMPLHQGGVEQQPTGRWALDEIRDAAHGGVWLRALRGLRNPRRRARWMRKLRLAARQLFRLGAAAGGRDASVAEWASEAVINSLNELAARNVPVMLLFGRSMSVYKDFLQLQAGPLRGFFAQAADRVKVYAVAGMPNNLTSLAVQDVVMDSTLEWIGSIIHPAQRG